MLGPVHMFCPPHPYLPSFILFSLFAAWKSTSFAINMRSESPPFLLNHAIRKAFISAQSWVRKDLSQDHPTKSIRLQFRYVCKSILIFLRCNQLLSGWMLSAGKVHVTIIHRVAVHQFVFVLVKVKSIIHYHPLVVLSGGRYRFCPILQPIQVIEMVIPSCFLIWGTAGYPLKSNPEVSIINSRKVVLRSSPILRFFILIRVLSVNIRSLNGRNFTCRNSWKSSRESIGPNARATRSCKGIQREKPRCTRQTWAKAMFGDKFNK